MYESQHRIKDTNNSLDPPPPPTGDCLVYKGIIRSQDHRPPPFQASRRLFIDEGDDKITLLDEF